MRGEADMHRCRGGEAAAGTRWQGLQRVLVGCRLKPGKGAMEGVCLGDICSGAEVTTLFCKGPGGRRGGRTWCFLIDIFLQQKRGCHYRGCEEGQQEM